MSINQIVSILWRRIWLLALGLIATVVGATAVVLLVPPRYEAAATASVDFGQADPVTGASPTAAATRGALGNLVALIESQRVALDVVKRLNLAGDPTLTRDYLSSGVSGQLGINEWVANTISKNVDAKPVEGTNVLSISYRSASPIQSALIANTYLASFEDMALELKVAAAQQTATWFEPQMEKLRADLEAARAKLVQYQKTTKLLAPMAGGGDSDMNPLLSTGTDLATAKGQLVALQSQVSAIDSGQGSSQSSLVDSPVLGSLKTSLASVGAELGRARTDLGANNPKVLALLASQKSLQDQINVEISTIRRTSLARIKALKDQIATLEANYSDQYGKMISVQGQRDELASIQREVAFRQEQLDNASKSAAAARLQSQLSFSNIATLDNANPPSAPTFPKIPLIAALALGAGLALGVIFALIAEALDRRIRVVSDLDYATASPLLGVIVKARGKSLSKPKPKGFSLSFPAAQR
jgi:uncharacterized protein involved in exopolysaccharide biosynthesis